MISEAKLKSEVDTSKTEEQSVVLEAGSAWVVRIEEQSVVVGCGRWVNGTGSRVSLGRRSRRALSRVGRGGWIHNKAGNHQKHQHR